MVFPHWLRVAFLVALVASEVHPADASVTVLVGEPFGAFGWMMPTGHTTIYLDRVCADGPLRLRMCRADEPAGVAIARLDAIGKIDWIAAPVMDFLYGVEDAKDVPSYVTAAQVEALRQSYRRRALEAVLPDGTEREASNKDWWETVGIAYSRRMWGYQLATTREQDEALIARLNAGENRHRYHLHKVNCADFAADVVNFYYPGTVKENRFADLHLMTPKQVARSVSRYGHTHPEAELKVIEIPQVPGTLPRSKPLRGAADMLLKNPVYVTVLTAVQPEVVVALLAVYLEGGRWDIGRGYEVAEPEDFYVLGAQTVADR